MPQSDEIRRRPNGSIDTDHYAQIGHQRRSEALYDGAGALGKLLSELPRRIVRIRARAEFSYLNDTCLTGVARAPR